MSIAYDQRIISSAREWLEHVIQSAHKKIRRLQEQCTHPNVVKKYGSNTGNYDPSQDCYWTDFTCPDCDKRWSEDGSV